MKSTRPVLPAPGTSITTPRLLLRPFQPSDLNDYHVLRTQSDVMMWTTSGKVDVDQEATQTWMNRFLPPNDANTYCVTIEQLSEPGKVIGTIGCHHSEPAEIGYMFRTEVWGKGFASEAMEYWLRAWWNLPRREIDIKSDDANESASIKVVPEKLKADVVVTNHASRRILEKFGFIPVYEEIVDDHQLPGQKIKVITLELQRPQ